MGTHTTNLNFEVNKDDLHDTRCSESTVPGVPSEGEIVVHIERFGFTANNITYAVYGDALGYWQFYPTAQGWGRIPVWGYARVVASAIAEVEVGERLFGYWPMARYTRLTPSYVSAGVLAEGAEQRQQLNPFYNRYTRCAADPSHDPEHEDWNCIFRPLGLTGWMLDDHLAAHELWGAERVIVASASSKTATSFAYYLRARGVAEVIALTSTGNLEFVQALDAYDSVLDYADIETLDTQTTSVFVDMAGAAAVVRRIHEHLGDKLQKSITVGGTHWREIAAAGQPGLPGPEPEFFFVPSILEQRLKDWGAAEFGQRAAQAWLQLLPHLQDQVSMVHGEGAQAVEDIYKATLEGDTAPDKAYILAL